MNNVSVSSVECHPYIITIKFIINDRIVTVNFNTNYGDVLSVSVYHIDLIWYLFCIVELKLEIFQLFSNKFILELSDSIDIKLDNLLTSIVISSVCKSIDYIPLNISQTNSRIAFITTI